LPERLCHVANDRRSEDDDRRVVEECRSCSRQSDEHPQACPADPAAKAGDSADRLVEKARELHRVGDDEERGERDDGRAREGALHLSWTDHAGHQKECRPGERNDIRAQLVPDQRRDHGDQD